MAEHLAGLARQHGIGLNVVKDMPPERAYALRAGFAGMAPVRIVTIAPVMDETTYAVALHEMGHTVAKNGVFGPCELCRSVSDVSKKILAEQSAWEWAKQNALDWTVAMEQNKQMSLHQYEEWALNKVRSIMRRHRAKKTSAT
jgi:hypothetical protein